MQRGRPHRSRQHCRHPTSTKSPLRLLTALFESGTTGIAVTLVGATAARTNPARAIAVSALAVFDKIVDEGGVESSREPNSEHDRQTSDLIFQGYMTRWPTSFLRAMMSERRAWAGSDFTCTGFEEAGAGPMRPPSRIMRSVLWVASDLTAG